jgi:hypothetical protein
MKQMIFLFAAQFSNDYSVKLPEITFRIAPLDTVYAMAERNGDVWDVTLDSATAWNAFTRDHERLKTLIYHELGHVSLGLPDTDNWLDYMNPYFCTDRFSKIKNKWKKR